MVVEEVLGKLDKVVAFLASLFFLFVNLLDSLKLAPYSLQTTLLSFSLLGRHRWCVDALGKSSCGTGGR